MEENDKSTYECPSCKKMVSTKDINLKFKLDNGGYVSLWKKSKDKNPFPEGSVLLVCSKCKD